MPISVVKGIMGLAIAVAVLLSMAAMSPRFDRYTSLALFLGGCAVIVVALLWYRRAMPQAEAREDESQAGQLVILKQQLTLLGEPVVVKARSGGILLLFVLAMFVLCGHAVLTDPNAGLTVPFIGLGVVTAILALFIGPRIGRPALVIRPDGLDVPMYGLLRWDEIESVGLRIAKFRGVKTHSIDLYVPELAERERQLNLWFRLSCLLLARRSPNFIGVHLLLPALPATLVYQLCYDVWKQRTGKARTWTATMSEQQIEQMRRTEQQFEQLKRVERDTDPARVKELLDEIDRQVKEQSSKWKSGKPLRPEAAARQTALMNDLSKLPHDPAAMHKLLERRADAHVRNAGTKLYIVLVVVAALAVTALTLFGE